MKKISLCADDYAITPKISAGIIELADAGRISATSVMTVSKYWPDAAMDLFKYKNEIDVGLHVTLTGLSPLTHMPTFAPNGKFPDVKKLIKMAYLNKLPLTEIKQEIEEQVQRFYLYFNCWPSHIDGHHHIHALPGIRDIILDIFSRFMRGEGYLRNCVASPVDIVKRRVGISKAMIISLLNINLKQKISKLGIDTNSSFSGIYDFSTQTDYKDIFKRFLLGSQDQLLIMCHPGYFDKELEKIDPVVESREKELRFLQSDDFLQMLQSNNMELSTFLC